MKYILSLKEQNEIEAENIIKRINKDKKYFAKRLGLFSKHAFGGERESIKVKINFFNSFIIDYSDGEIIYHTYHPKNIDKEILISLKHIEKILNKQILIKNAREISFGGG